MPIPMRSSLLISDSELSRGASRGDIWITSYRAAGSVLTVLVDMSKTDLQQVNGKALSKAVRFHPIGCQSCHSRLDVCRNSHLIGYPKKLHTAVVWSHTPVGTVVLPLHNTHFTSRLRTPRIISAPPNSADTNSFILNRSTGSH